MNVQTLPTSESKEARTGDAHAPRGGASAQASDAAARRWLAAWVVAAALIAGLTLTLRTWPGVFEPVLGLFDLGRESNLAAWFSASSLLWSGLLMWSSAALLRGQDRWAAAAVAVFGGLALMLCVDEAGSLHERFDLLVPAALGLSLKKVAAVMAVPVLASVVILFRRQRVLGHQWALLLGAYALFASVFAQEMLEHAVTWREGLLPLRTAIEEGTELVGFFLLLLAAVRLRRRCRGLVGDDGDASRHALVLPARSALVVALAVAALATPVMVLWSLSIPAEQMQFYKRGDFASSLMMAMFLITGALCLRRATAAGPGRAGWCWVALGCVLLSLLHNWHAYSDVQAVVKWGEPLPLWRTCFDLAWVLPVFIAVTLLTRRHTGMRWWVAAVFALVWLAALVAAWKATYKMSYAASYLAAVVIGGWVVCASRCRPGDETQGG